MKKTDVTLTILTPAFNREKELVRLYDSLKKQTCRDFEWLVVDDGSRDNTREKVIAWQEEEILPIRYLPKENGGKHTALNVGISAIKSVLTFIVDSDDWLPEKAVETILKYHRKYSDTPGLCGYSFLRFYPDGRVNEAFFPENEKIDTYVNARINGGIAGDKAEVFFTDILKKYPFPVYKEEKFLPEDLIWVRISGPYQMVHINECIYISEYLEGGLTKSGRRMKMKSPKGMTARSLVYLQDEKVCRKAKLKMMLLYQVYGRLAGYSRADLRKNVPCRLLFLACRIPAGIILQDWKRKYMRVE